MVTARRLSQRVQWVAAVLVLPKLPNHEEAWRSRRIPMNSGSLRLYSLLNKEALAFEEPAVTSAVALE